MPRHWSPHDEPFFREWRARRPGQRRSLARARRVAERLGIPATLPPTLTVVGSKGKGTIATYASALLAAAGLRVGTLLSPSVLHNRERFRLNGVAASEAEYAAASGRTARALDAERAAADEGYLSPTGLFTLAGVRHLLDERCDVLVLEAGMGGASDEVSLFAPTVVACGPVFAEHVGIIGDSVEEIARDKLGVARADTRAIVSVPQRPEVDVVLREVSHALGVPAVVVHGDDAPETSAPLPPGLSRVNAVTGLRAATRLLDAAGRAAPSRQALDATLASVRIAGRLSVHRDERGRTWVVDAAVNAEGVATALAWCDATVGRPDVVLLSFPDEKDAAGLERVLAGRRVLPVSVPTPHIHYAAPSPFGAHLPFDALDGALPERGLVLALGTWSFVGHVLDRLGVGNERLWDATRTAS